MSIRRTASCGQPRQLSSVPRGARTGRAPGSAVIRSGLAEAVQHDEAQALVARRRHRDEDALVLEPHVIGPQAARAGPDVDGVALDGRARLADDLALAGAGARVVGVPPVAEDPVVERVLPEPDDER